MNQHSRNWLIGALLLSSSLTLHWAFAEEDQTHFSPVLWKQQLVHKPREHVNRMDQFKMFLHDYNIIGMSKEEVVKLLGEEDKFDGYLIVSGNDQICRLQIKYEDEKIKKWRLWGYRTGNEEDGWQTTNVLFTDYQFVDKK